MANLSGSVLSDTNATLKELTLERYLVHSGNYVLTAFDGTRVTNGAAYALKAITADMWREATGNSNPVPAKERKAGERSFGQYLSNFHKVATDLDFGGIELLEESGVEGAKVAKELRAVSNKVAKENDEQAEQALSDIADLERFNKFLTGANKKTQDAYNLVIKSLRGDDNSHQVGFMLKIKSGE